jgi:formylglycine-generating enzyme required for sulfatase activity
MIESDCPTHTSPKTSTEEVLPMCHILQHRLIMLTILALLCASFTSGALTQDANPASEGENVTKTETVMLPGDVPLEMVWIEPGTFMMGRPSGELSSEEKEHPQHSVTLTQGFWMGKYEVTIRQYIAFLDMTGDASDVNWNSLDCPITRNRGSYTLRRTPLGQSELQPMVGLSWHGAEAFAAWAGGRLPTEAEWEYACRAGTTTRFYWGDDLKCTVGNDYAWWPNSAWEVSERKYAPLVGEKKPNAWGLYDMSGNVWEWCSDWYGTYPSGSVTDPTGAASGSQRLTRGGSLHDTVSHSRSADRVERHPLTRFKLLGFRLAR